MALYDSEEKTVYIQKKNYSDKTNMSYLIHELIHHYQFESGNNKKVRCINELEKEAYEIQVKFLEQHTTDSDLILKIKISGLVFGTCRSKTY
jgi:hypothetical protein